MSGLIAADLALIVVEPAALGLRGIGAVADAIDEVWNGSQHRSRTGRRDRQQGAGDQRRGRTAIRRTGADRRAQHDLAAVGARSG